MIKQGAKKHTTQSKLSPHALRAEIAKRFAQIIVPKQEKSLDTVLKPNLLDAQQHAWLSAALYGMCRYYPRYKIELAQRLQKPFKEKDADLEALLVLGMHQLAEMRLKPHAALNETVNATQVLNKTWAKSLVNAILRAYQRDLETGLVYESEAAGYAHPKWFIKLVKQDWPQQWEAILRANNQQAPLTLRVNQARWDRTQALEALALAKIAVRTDSTHESVIELTEARDVNTLPKFMQGYFSVQDASAQLAATLLLTDEDINTELTILDACAAPGGKTGHLLERMAPDSELIAVEKFENRAKLINSNLERIALEKNIKVVVSDVIEYIEATDKRFDRILADVPCTASGVIRRHPDIKLRRNVNQISKVIAEQKAILESLWARVKTSGRLLYATCSVFKAENHAQIQAFVATHSDAKVIPLNINAAINTEFGSQILPGSENRDGFFYALLEKQAQ